MIGCPFAISTTHFFFLMFLYYLGELSTPMTRNGLLPQSAEWGNRGILVGLPMGFSARLSSSSSDLL